MFSEVRIYVNQVSDEKSTGEGTSLVLFVYLSIHILSDPSVSFSPSE